MKSPTLLFASLLSNLIVMPPAQADAVLDLNLAQQNAKTQTQSVEAVRLSIHDGSILIRTQADASGKDLLFEQKKDVFHWIDHRHRKIMRMDEAAVIQFTDQTQAMLNMARGFSKQLALLPPNQRSKLENMLGSGGELAELAKRGDKPTGKQSLRKAGNKTIGGVACQSTEILGNGNKLAELCLSKALPIPEQDYATLEAMRQLAQRLALRAAPLAQQVGFPLPPLDDAKLSGVPIEMKNLTGDKRESLSLTHVSAEPVAAQLLEIPAGYKAKAFSAWKF